MMLESYTDDLLTFLRKWRNADDEDAITLRRSQVCLLLDRIEKLQDTAEAYKALRGGVVTLEQVRRELGL